MLAIVKTTTDFCISLDKVESFCIDITHSGYLCWVILSIVTKDKFNDIGYTLSVSIKFTLN